MLLRRPRFRARHMATGSHMDLKRLNCISEGIPAGNVSHGFLYGGLSHNTSGHSRVTAMENQGALPEPKLLAKMPLQPEIRDILAGRPGALGRHDA